MGAYADTHRRQFSLVKTSVCPQAGRPFTVPENARIMDASESTMAITKLYAIDDPEPILVTVRGIASFGSSVPAGRILRVERIANRVKHSGFTVKARIDTLYAKEA